MSGKIILCATPIGNLGDITLRALEALRECDIIAAEDTRHTLKLLNHYDIRKPMLSFHEHNRLSRGAQLVDLAREGRTIVVVSDAGLPGISDPGQELVALAHEQGIPVTVLPGASAGLTALVLSGMDTQRFVFEGFLPKDGAKRRERLALLQGQHATMVLYESPHHLLKTLRDLTQTLGERRITLVRELTKLHEQRLEMTLPEAVEYYEHHAPQGEFVLLLEGAPEAVVTAEDVEDVLVEYAGDERPASHIAREIALRTGLPKGKVYAMLVHQREGSDI